MKRKELITTIVGGILLFAFMSCIAVIAGVAPASDTAPGALMFLSLVAAAQCLYFLPTLIAFGRQHQHWVPILLVNLFFGWTGLGWVAALVWASMPVAQTSVQPPSLPVTN